MVSWFVMIGLKYSYRHVDLFPSLCPTWTIAFGASGSNVPRMSPKPSLPNCNSPEQYVGKNARGWLHWLVEGPEDEEAPFAWRCQMIPIFFGRHKLKRIPDDPRLHMLLNSGIKGTGKPCCWLSHACFASSNLNVQLDLGVRRPGRPVRTSNPSIPSRALRFPVRRYTWYSEHMYCTFRHAPTKACAHDTRFIAVEIAAHMYLYCSWPCFAAKHHMKKKKKTNLGI